MTALPLVEELRPCPAVIDVLAAFAELPGTLLLHSALERAPVGRYSFLTADPFRFFEIPAGCRWRTSSTAGASEDNQTLGGSNMLAELRGALASFPATRIADLPPFQGGAAGLLGYELAGAWENLPVAGVDEFKLPQLAVGIYDWVLAWDHADNSAWIISHGFPETDVGRQTDRAAARLRLVRDRLSRSPSGLSERPHPSALLPADTLAPQWPAPGLRRLTSNFSKADYLKAVECVIDYVVAGDIFQANLSQRLLYPQEQSSLDLYRRLCASNPAPFAGYFAHDDWAIASASPERFVHVSDREVETRPIKGTRQRRPAPEADLFSRDELRESLKDRAENVMIVDLLRNDLSRVCEPGSVRVPQLCAVETFETVQHLVSEIRARLSPGRDAWDLLQAVFPGGSITGAPKVRAIEIIAELEPTVRGPYCGSLFYNGFDGSADSSILIRTFTCRRGWVQCPVGGGIVAQSDPLAEYQETLHKAEGMLRALAPR